MSSTELAAHMFQIESCFWKEGLSWSSQEKIAFSTTDEQQWMETQNVSAKVEGLIMELGDIVKPWFALIVFSHSKLSFTPYAGLLRSQR
jgi:hypothetical protein